MSEGIVEGVMDSGGIELVIDYTRKFIEAAAPVAQKAYEIGLLTLRIDAAETIAMSVAFLALSVLVLRKIYADCKVASAKAELPENKRDYCARHMSDHLPALGMMHFMIGSAMVAICAASLINLTRIWIWVKLFAPELWLAHQAIEKIVR